MSGFTTPTLTVGELLANPNFLQVPAYQRSFAWEEKEVCRFLDHLVSAFGLDGGGRSAPECFLGPMLFLQTEAPPALRWTRSRARLLDIVDGLQRLTTLTMLLCSLRDRDTEDGVAPHPRVRDAIGAAPSAKARHRWTLRGPDEAFFHAFVRAPDATRLEPPDGTLSVSEARIIEARAHISAMLDTLDASERRKFADFLLGGCHLVYIATGDIDRAHQMFTVLNTTGKPLARNDILKADLLGRVPQAAADQALAVWEAAERRLGARFEQLFSHIRDAVHPRSDGRIIVGIKQIAEEMGGAQAFIERLLQPSADILAAILAAEHTGAPQSAAICRTLRYLGMNTYADWIPPALAWWLGNDSDPAGLARILARLDRLAVGMRLLGLGDGKRKSRFAAVTSAIRYDRDLDGPDSPLQFTRPELRSIEHNLRDIHSRHGATAKLLLRRLNDALAGGPQPELDAHSLTVEHVVPRKHNPDSQWRAWFPDPTERDRWTGSIGNLVLVTKAQNDKAGNHEFARKLQIYFSTRGAPYVAINQSLRDKSRWAAEDIKAREAAMFELIEELWQFGLLSQKAKAA